MGGLLEGQRGKSTQEFAPSGGPNMKQRPSVQFQIRTKFGRVETQRTILAMLLLEALVVRKAAMC
jgi:hypothetical protein